MASGLRGDRYWHLVGRARRGGSAMNSRGVQVLAARLLANPNARMLFNLSLLWSGQIVTKAISFIAFAILARRLAPAEYGAVEYAMGLGTIAALAVEGGLAAVGVRRLTQGETPARALALLIPSTQTCLAAVVAPGIVLFAWLFGNDPRATALVVPIAVSILILPWRQEWLFQSYGRMAPIVGAQVLRVSIFSVGVILLVPNGASLSLVGVLEVVSVAAAAAFLLVLQQRSIAPVGFRFAPREMGDLAREGASIAISAALWALMQYAPLMLLANMEGMADGAFFGAAHRLGVSLVTFSAIYHFNLFPTLAGRIANDRPAADALMRTSVRASAWAGIGLALGLALAAEPLMGLLFGDAFRVAAPAFQALIWVFPITLLAGHARWALIAARLPNQMMWAQVVGFGVAVLFGWLLIARHGAVGAGISMSLASFSVWIVNHLTAVAHGKAPPLLPCLLPGIAAAVIFFGAPLLELNPWVTSALSLCAFAALALLFDRALLRDIASLRPGRSGQTGPEAA